MRKHLIHLLFAVIFCMTLVSCGKSAICFDKQLYEQHKNDVCTMDCPGVEGCDGNTYCNECIAATRGIRVRK